jgi:heme A synthase
MCGWPTVSTLKENTMKLHHFFGMIFTILAVILIVHAVQDIASELDEFNQNFEQQTQQSDTAPTTKWKEPYGGCKEAAANPGTPGYEQCAARGLVP